MKSGAVRLSLEAGPRYIPAQLVSTRLRQVLSGETSMAAIIALGLAFGIFALLNLIDYKRLD